MKFWERVLTVLFTVLIVGSCAAVGIAAAVEYNEPFLAVPFLLISILICSLGWNSPEGLAATILWVAFAYGVFNLMPGP